MLFRKKRSPEDSIGKLTRSIGLHEGNRISWSISTPALGRCALKLADNSKAGVYYELNTVTMTDENSPSRLRATRFVYLPDGEILGVLRSEVDTIERNDEAIEEAMDFQIESGLSRPTSKDKRELVELLEARVQ